MLGTSLPFLGLLVSTLHSNTKGSLIRVRPSDPNSVLGQTRKPEPGPPQSAPSLPAQSPTQGSLQGKGCDPYPSVDVPLESFSRAAASSYRAVVAGRHPFLAARVSQGPVEAPLRPGAARLGTGSPNLRTRRGPAQ